MEDILRTFWCDVCKVPIINNNICTCGKETKFLSNDLRPVFPEERKLMFYLTQDKNFLNGYVWASKGLFYYFNGEQKKYSLDIFNNISQTDLLIDLLQNQNLNEEYELFNKEISTFVKNNSLRLNELQYYSSNIVKESVKQYSSSLPIISFSGGKDSTVASHLVITSLSNPSILHIFGDQCVNN